jgi:hypothetical protein
MRNTPLGFERSTLRAWVHACSLQEASGVQGPRRSDSWSSRLLSVQSRVGSARRAPVPSGSKMSAACCPKTAGLISALGGGTAICWGIDTFLCVADTNILSEPAGGSCIGSISPGETVLASGARQVPSKGSWVRIGLGWVAISTTIGDVTTVHLEAAGCERQCGGVCECASTCTGQTKSRHGCDFRLQFDRTLEQVPQRLVRVTVIGKHSSSKWAPLPLDNRAVSPRTRQVILKKMTNKDTARKVQLNLNTEALVSGATTNEDGVVTDHSVVPSKKVSALSNVSINAYSESFC